MSEINHETLWKRKTALFLTSQTISIFGSSLVQFAIMWYITLISKSGVVLMLASMCSFLPQIAVTLFAGVWADRYDRRRIIVLSDSAIALSTLVLALIMLSGYKELWLIMSVSVVRSFGSGIQSPAVGALLPQLVPSEHLMRVNGINSTLQSLLMLISPAVSGALFGMFGLQATLFVDVVTALIAVVLMSTLKVPLHQGALEESVKSHWDDLKEGFQYVVGHRFIRSLLIFYAYFMFLIVPAAMLSPLMVARTFGPEVWKLTATEVLFSSGTLLGGLFVALWGGFRNKIHTIGASSIAFGVMTVAMGLATNFWVFLGIMVVTGVFIPFFNGASMVLFQESVEERMLGRVLSFNNIVSVSAFPVGMLVFGPLADIVSVEILFLVSGVALGLVGIMIFFNKNLMKGGISN